MQEGSGSRAKDQTPGLLDRNETKKKKESVPDVKRTEEGKRINPEKEGDYKTEPY